jgi:hypothetical protein
MVMDFDPGLDPREDDSEPEIRKAGWRWDKLEEFHVCVRLEAERVCRPPLLSALKQADADVVVGTAARVQCYGGFLT